MLQTNWMIAKRKLRTSPSGSIQWRSRAHWRVRWLATSRDAFGRTGVHCEWLAIYSVNLFTEQCSVNLFSKSVRVSQNWTQTYESLLSRPKRVLIMNFKNFLVPRHTYSLERRSRKKTWDLSFPRDVKCSVRRDDGIENGWEYCTFSLEVFFLE